MALFRYRNLPEDFTFAELARSYLDRQRGDLRWTPLAETEFRFIARTRRPVPAAGTETFAGAVLAGIPGAHLRLVPHLIREQDEAARPPPEQGGATPTVRRRLPEFIRGSLLRLSAGADAGRRRIVLDAYALLDAAAGLLAADPGREDAFAIGPLIDGHLRTIIGAERRLAEEQRLKVGALAAFHALADVERELMRARRDVAASAVETTDLLRIVRGEHGAVRPDAVNGRTVLVGRSDEPRFVAVARRERAADVVIQLSWTGRRVLVIGDAVGVLHVAALLRNADAAKRLGRLPAASAAVCAAGRVAPEDAPPTFALSASGMVVGNMPSLDPDAPASALTDAELVAYVRAALDLRGSPALKAAIDPARGVLTEATLAAAAMPER